MGSRRVVKVLYLTVLSSSDFLLGTRLALALGRSSQKPSLAIEVYVCLVFS